MAAVLVLAAVTLTGCSQNAGPFMALLTNTGTSDDGADLAVEQETAADVFSRSGIYDSEDAAVVVKKDLEAGTVQFQNIATSRRYTLTYDGTTTVYDKNDQALSMEQLKEGSVVTVRFYKPRKALAYVKENPDCVSYSNVRSYSMDLRKGTIAIGDELYNISGHVVVVSDGREADMMEVNQMDVLSVWGYKNMIYGINVEKGHGYLRLHRGGPAFFQETVEAIVPVIPDGGKAGLQLHNFAGKGDGIRWRSFRRGGTLRDADRGRSILRGASGISAGAFPRMDAALG